MKKILTTLVIISTLFISASTVFAQDLGSGYVQKASEKAGYKAVTDTTLAENVGGIVRGILSLTGVIFTVLLVYAGILWMTAHGEESQVEKAKDIITTSVIGLVIALSAYSITAFVVPRIMGNEPDKPVVEKVDCCKVCPDSWFASDKDCTYERSNQGTCLTYCQENQKCEFKKIDVNLCVGGVPAQ